MISLSVILKLILVGASLYYGYVSNQLLVYSARYDCSYCQPEQIHLAFGETTNQMVVMWSTQDDMKIDSIVHYGNDTMDKIAKGKSWLFGPGDHRQWIHKVVLKDLEFNTSYLYNVGSEYAWSERFMFKTPPAGDDWVVSAAIYGDMGLENAQSVPYLQQETERGDYNFILHVGDFAYDLHTNDGYHGDQFFKQIEPIASSVPYMVCPGNHEAAYNFSNYKQRFSMPGNNDNMYYSWNIGPVHFLGFSTEFYYDNDTTSPYWLQSLKQQLNWIRMDLTEASKEQNREKTPWIILYGHRPFYCSSKANECAWSDVPQRAGDGLPEPGLGLEPLLKEFGVDLVIFGHEHSYERMLPLYNFTIFNGTDGNPYINPQAPVNLITGSAGCSEDTYKIDKNKPWTVVSSSDYGYTKFKAFNRTHLFFEQISVDKNGEVIDSFWLVRENHTAYDI